MEKLRVMIRMPRKGVTGTNKGTDGQPTDTQDLTVREVSQPREMNMTGTDDPKMRGDRITKGMIGELRDPGTKDRVGMTTIM